MTVEEKVERIRIVRMETYRIANPELTIQEFTERAPKFGIPAGVAERLYNGKLTGPELRILMEMGVNFTIVTEEEEADFG